jgi:excisionase family DNA binding protein
MTDRLLTARQVAADVGVSAETVLRWTRRGELPAIKLPGGAIRYRERDLEAWLEEHKTAGDANRGASTAPDATRQVGVSSVASTAPLRGVAAPTEEEP